MSTLLLMLVGVVAAFVMPVQAIVNARLGQVLDHRLFAAFVSFAGGTLILGVLTLISSGGLPAWPVKSGVPWYLMTGGLMGAIFVTTVLTLAPKIGVANVVTATMVGQLFMSMLLDHFGALQIPQVTLSLPRVIGALLLIGGAWLVQWKS